MARDPQPLVRVPKGQPVRALGIDPGTVRMGYGLVDERGDETRLMECGVLEAPAKNPIEQRLLALHRSLTALLDRMRPEVMAVEEPFTVQAARKSAMSVGEARAVALICAAAAGVPVFQYTPTKVRSTVTSYGASTKEQVQHMVSLILRAPLAGQRLDASDALAVAICHLRHVRLGEMIEHART